MFSIVIPTYNNIQYLKILLLSLKKNSVYTHEIILHVNEGNDGTLDFVKDQKIKHTYTKNNVGLCTATNLAAARATTKYILTPDFQSFMLRSGSEPIPGLNSSLKPPILSQ